MIFRWSSPFRVFGALVRLAYARARGYETLASPLVESNRLSLCFACEHYDEAQEQCRICTCLVRAKVLLATEKCPVGRWQRVWLHKTAKAGTIL